MFSTTTGEGLALNYNGLAADAVAVTARDTNGAYVPTSQFGGFKLLVYCSRPTNGRGFGPAHRQDRSVRGVSTRVTHA
jgi:hypothetical protein